MRRGPSRRPRHEPEPRLEHPHPADGPEMVRHRHRGPRDPRGRRRLPRGRHDGPVERPRGRRHRGGVPRDHGREHPHREPLVRRRPLRARLLRDRARRVDPQVPRVHRRAPGPAGSALDRSDGLLPLRRGERPGLSRSRRRRSAAYARAARERCRAADRPRGGGAVRPQSQLILRADSGASRVW